MGPEVVNRNKNCTFNGPSAGRDMYYITMMEDKDREFIVSHKSNIKSVAYFTGRETELQDLRQSLEHGKKSVLVSGMGGIGKTHICRKLFEEYSYKKDVGGGTPFHRIGFIEYDGNMDSSLLRCLKFKKQENSEHDQEAAWIELEYLASDGKLLLFIDNVNTPMSEDSGLQRLNSIPGAILLTSRLTSLSGEFEPYRIGFLTTEQCVEIYEKIRFENSGKKVKEEEIPELEYIIEKMAARHTITVEFLAHLSRTKLWSVKQLKETLDNKGFRLDFHKDGEHINIQSAYEALYDLAGLSKAEQNILEAFSIFPYLPLDVKTCNEWLLSDAGAGEDDDIIMGLYQKGWLQFDMEQESYAMHPVFAQFIFDKCRPEFEKHSKLMEACQKSLVIPDSGSALECQKYLPFAENMIEKVVTGKSVEQADFMLGVAYSLEYVLAYKKAEILFSNCLKIYQDKYGEKHPATATCYNDLAGVYNNQGNYEKAVELYGKSLSIFEQIYGEVHSDTAACRNNFAKVYIRQRDYDKAKRTYENSLRVFKQVYGETHPETARCYNNLAEIYDRQGDHDKAKELVEKSFNIFKQVYGDMHPDIAICYNNLAEIYGRQGDYDKAKELYVKSLNVLKQVYGEGHQNTAICNSNLATVYYKLYDYENALDYYSQAYMILFPQFKVDSSKVYKNMKFVFTKLYPNEDFNIWLEEKISNIEEIRNREI